MALNVKNIEKVGFRDMKVSTTKAKEMVQGFLTMTMAAKSTKVYSRMTNAMMKKAKSTKKMEPYTIKVVSKKATGRAMVSDTMKMSRFSLKVSSETVDVTKAKNIGVMPL